MKKGWVIAIDGPSGAGKSTVAKELAKRLGYRYIDTGAMYRAAALSAKTKGVDINDHAAMKDFLRDLHIKQEMSEGQVRTFVDGKEVSDLIRSAEMGMRASAISAIPEVRQKLTALQREMGESGAVVMEGRDIGTVVFPDADYKFFLTASAEERARRRAKELQEKGEPVEFAQILEQILARDENDSRREVAPLAKAEDAEEIDTTGLSVDQVVKELLSRIPPFKGG